MSTPEERQRIAKRLKANVGNEISPGASWLMLGGRVLGIIQSASPREMFSCLADLIDPTCEITVTIPDAKAGEFVPQMMEYECSACGHDMPNDPYTGRWPKYCPNCGARVTAFAGEEK